MCGFVGFLGGTSLRGKSDDFAVLNRMTRSIENRGPDDAGHWVDVEKRIGLGHRRLSIVDLSATGHQPMESPSNRYTIVFNGEIYNHLELRQSLEKSFSSVNWRGYSDTETLLAGFDAWGVRATLERSVGMFAFALWDRETSTLMLARDRLGEKPLYYGWQRNGSEAVFLFGSELKALRKHPSFANMVDRGALTLQLRNNYVPAPHSIYEGIQKLTPGSLLSVSLREPNVRIETYWDGARIATNGNSSQFAGTDEEAVGQLEFLLKQAIRQQMVAEVPLGAFLSGGIDSSTIVALMQAQSSRPVKTFSIGFDEEGYDEAKHAKAVAQHLGTEHTELYVTAQQAIEVIPKLPTLFDEPFSDSSQIPTFLVAQLARQHVTVSLSGDAGDELFCGYKRYPFAESLWSKIGKVPLPLRQLTSKGLTLIPPKTWNETIAPIRRFLPRRLQRANLGDKLHKGAALLNIDSCDSLYLSLMSHWTNSASVVIGGTEPAKILHGGSGMLAGLGNIQRMMALDMLTYLPDDILVKVDRAAMGVSLETRVPFLDHRIVEFAWALPQSFKLREGSAKWILRQVLYRYVPRSLVERPKMGFAVPMASWLRGPLRDWAETLLDETRLRQEGYFHPAPIRQKWKEHLSGQRNWQYHLWDVLMFQAWLETNK
jgi:asparagine synthase (glutamine-hydrolysing)